jgi:thiol:disulfide interchange protein DsbD
MVAPEVWGRVAVLVKAVQDWVKPEVDPPSVGAAARGVIRRGGGTDQLSFTTAAPVLLPRRTNLLLVPSSQKFGRSPKFLVRGCFAWRWLRRARGVLERSMTIVLRLALALVFLLFAGSPVSAQLYDGKTLVKASLLADTTALVPGQPFQVGLLLEMAPGWHTYWEYSGDSGLPTTIDWRLPPGFEAGAIQWPVPEAKVEPGDIQVYAYSGRVLLLTTITPPRDASGDVTLRAAASWLVCAEICVPGGAELELTLPVENSAAPANAALFEEFRSRLPSKEAPPFDLVWKRTGDVLALQIKGVPSASPLALYPLPAKDQIVGHPAFEAPDTLTIKAASPFTGVLSAGEGPARRAWFVSDTASAEAAITSQSSTLSLWVALFYGFLGGLILNLMPCVLPVISLKIFGFINQAGDSRRSILLHGLAFAAGIFVWFLGLAAVIIGLKSGGTEVTWAFQFQNPWFNVVIGSVVFVFALNLAGVFEFVLPGRASNAMESAGSTSGLTGSFFQGVFATLLATPCTAPFLGSALGFAFSQSAAVIFAMFAAVASGMALPYLILSASPGWLKFLPRPGVWMEHLKQFMAFPLLATLVWILSILGGQRGTDGVIWFCAFLLCLAFACWILGSFCGPLASRAKQTIALLFILATLGLGGWYFLGKKFAHVGLETMDRIAWVPFSKARVEEELAAGRSVFVDFTADWCITCKFNERTAIDTPTIRALLKEKNITPIKADWTNANPEITAALKSFGRVGVPLYVIYAGSDPQAPVVLPELLTESLLTEALKKIP